MKKLDRQTAYSDFNIHVRMASCAAINAASNAHAASLLHPSRQNPHLDVSADWIDSAIESLLKARAALQPMRDFVPYDSRKRK